MPPSDSDRAPDLTSQVPSLFYTLPAALFRPLASPGAEIYARILLALFAESSQRHYPLSRELALDVTIACLPDAQALTLTDDARDPESVASDLPGSDAVTLQAGAILRYLERCGWLQGETQSDFTQTFIFPSYAFRLLRVLSELAADEPLQLAGLISSVHDLLNAAVSAGDLAVRGPQAARQTEQLVLGLQELHHNIGRHINHILEALSTHEVLETLFSTYRSEIVDRAYHALRTTAHVARYRQGILAAADQLIGSKALDDAARQLRERGEADTPEQASHRLQAQLATIRNYFESLDDRLRSIDQRHSQFVNAAVRAVELRLAAQTTTSGQLDLILRGLLSERGQKALPLVEPLVQAYRLELPDNGSLAAPMRAGQPFEPEPEEAPRLADAERAAALDETLRQLNRAVSRTKIQRLAREWLHRRASEMPLAGPDELPVLIYLRAYGDGSLGYRAEELETWVTRGEIAFRDFRLLPVETVP